MKLALIVFAKCAEPGKVKTRLVPPLTPEEACILYECFLKDAFEQYFSLASEMDLKVFLAVTPAGTEPYFINLMNSVNVKYPVTIMEQKGSDLGERIHNAFRSVFASSHDPAVVIGTDHPTLPDAFVREAFFCLKDSRIDSVIGPAEDGGYYLLGLRETLADYFQGISWSTGQVFDETLWHIKRNNKTIRQLPKWYDVDDENSFFRLISDISAKNGNVPFHTKQFLDQFKKFEVS